MLSGVALYAGPHVRLLQRHAVNVGLVEGAYRAILSELPVNGDGIADTPRRAAEALAEMTSGYHVDVAGLFTTFDADGYDEMIVEGPIPFQSLCEHHILPFTGHAWVAYVPNEEAGRIVGLSKLARLVQAFSRRLQVQERITTQVADALVEHLSPEGVMVVCRAEHMCMSLRGVRTHDVNATTSVVRGLMKDDPRARAEALSLMGIK